MELHLATPIMTPAPGMTPERLHFVVTDLPIGFIKLTNINPKATFVLDTDEVSNLSKIILPTRLHEVPRRPDIRSGSVILQLRCISIPAGTPIPTTRSEWASHATFWPKHTFAEINYTRIEFRRAERWGADHPADITNQVRAGINNLNILTLSYDATPNAPTYLAAIEVITLSSEDKIKATLARLPEDDTMRDILARLRRSSDPDLIVASSTVSIGVKCPLSFQLMALPVRARACKHLDCFDADNYLASRRLAEKGMPPAPGAYKCPHCGGRAQPEDLVVDGFLVRVLEKIREEGDGEGEAKCVVVDEKGEWVVKREVVEKQERMGSVETAREVIELDDD
jgi:hypothetical protein